jgi:TIR domain
VRAIFISYRRQDSEGEAGRLFDDLVTHFGERSVFMDVETIEVGRDFRKAIDDSVAGCGVLLAIIGPAWLGAQTESGQRRLDDANDFVRVETASALRRDIPVIPILVRAAKMPKAEHLPADLADIAYRNAVELTHARWKSDVQILVKALRSSLAVSSDRPDAAHPSSIGLDSIVGADAKPTAPEAYSAVEQIGRLDPAALAGVTRELAQYIGPVAELVVRRAATRCAGISDLRRCVAEEIDVLTDRARFLDASRER